MQLHKIYIMQKALKLQCSLMKKMSNKYFRCNIHITIMQYITIDSVQSYYLSQDMIFLFI